MHYTAITDEEEVMQAFEDLWSKFKEGAHENGRYDGAHCYYHRNRNDLWGVRGKHHINDADFIGFGRGGFGSSGEKRPIFEMNYRAGKDGGQDKGVFVQDDEGNRYLTHSGNLRTGEKDVREKLMEVTDDDFWIVVKGNKHKRLLVTPIDSDDPPELIDRINQVTKEIENFKKGIAACPTTPDGTTTEDSSKRRTSSALNTILYGPPGTGKTYATFRRCVEICDGEEDCPNESSKVRDRYKELVEKGRIEFVTFHQSYGYEEFVEGLRPGTGSAKEGRKVGAGFRLVPTDGVLKLIADRARDASGPTGDAEASADAKPHVLVIDEINRANISKVMGELITLLEEDKREGAENEVAVTLPHSRDRFTLPANLYLLGTMNTADRSIALLDTALRRRFEFEELAPAPDLLGDAAKATGIDLPAVLRAINERLEYLIDRDHLIGHAWLMGARTKADVDRIMRRKIIPLIAEYFYDDWQKVQAVLGGADDFVQGEALKPPPGLGDTDAGEDRRRWTVLDQFKEGAYDRLISGRVRGSGQTRDQEQDQGSEPAPDTEAGTD